MAIKTHFVSLHQRFLSLNKPIRIGSYLIAAYLIYALLLGVMTPVIVQSQLPKLAKEQLGREVQLQEVKINPFLLRFRLNNFAIAAQDGKSEFVSFKQLELELSFWRSVKNLQPVIDHFDLIEPAFNITRIKADKFNFSDIIEHLANQSTVQAEQTTVVTDNQAETPITALLADRISVQQGQVFLTDQVTGTELQYHTVEFSLSQLDTHAFAFLAPVSKNDQQAQNSNQYSFSLTGEDQGQLALSGQFQIQPLQVDGDLKLSSLTLMPFWPLVKEQIAATLVDGQVDFASHFSIKQQNDEIVFNTDSGQFALNGLVFSDGTLPKVTLPKLSVDGIAVNSQTQQVNLDKILVEQLGINAMVDSNGVDLQRLFTPVSNSNAESAKQAEAQSTSEPANPWLIKLNQFGLTKSDINVRESVASNGVQWRIHPLNFSTKQIISDLSKPIEYQLDLAISSSASEAKPEIAKGQFSSQGKVNVDKQFADGSIKLDGLDLAQLQPYLVSILNIKLDSGNLNTQGDFSVNSQGKATYQGSASVNSLLIRDGLENEPLLRWKSMAMDAIQFDLAGQSLDLDIDRILLTEPYAKVIIAKDRRTNIGEIAVHENANHHETANQQVAETTVPVQPSASTTSAENADFSLDIGKIEVANGSAYFADYSLTPNFASGIEQLNGYIEHISSNPETRAKVALQGKVDRYAPVTLSGEVNPLLDSPYLDLDFILDSAELTSVNPYSGTYVGYYIDKGQLSLDINYKLERNKLKGSNHVMVDQLQLGKASHSDLATNLPISLAIALLQDSKGVIDLGVDVSGDLDSPEFSIGGIILKALGNVITKAVTAPFSLLANLVGSDEELNLVSFKPGLSELDAAEQARLSKLAKALTDRPRLQVSIEGSVAPDEDSHALAEIQLHNKLLHLSGLTELPADLTASRIPQSGPIALALEQLSTQELGKNVEQERSLVEQQLLVESTDQQQAVDPEQVTSVLHIGLYNQLLSAQKVDQEMLGELADSRAKATKVYLVEQSQLDPGRIFVLNSKVDIKSDASQAVITLDAN